MKLILVLLIAAGLTTLALDGLRRRVPQDRGTVPMHLGATEDWSPKQGYRHRPPRATLLARIAVARARRAADRLDRVERTLHAKLNDVYWHACRMLGVDPRLYEILTVV